MAEQSRQPITDHLRPLPPSLPALSPEEEGELEALRHLSDDALWTLARERLGVQQEERLQWLMDKNTSSVLKTEERAELEYLVERGERLLLRKSQAAALLAQRGIKIEPQALAQSSMSDLQAYITQRTASDPEFAQGLEAGYSNSHIGIILRQAREAAGLTQEQVANQLGTHKSAISRIENHAEDVRLSTLRAYAQAVGATLQIQLINQE